MARADAAFSFITFLLVPPPKKAGVRTQEISIGLSGKYLSGVFRFFGSSRNTEARARAWSWIILLVIYHFLLVAPGIPPTHRNRRASPRLLGKEPPGSGQGGRTVFSAEA